MHSVSFEQHEQVQKETIEVTQRPEMTVSVTSWSLLIAINVPRAQTTSCRGWDPLPRCQWASRSALVLAAEMESTGMHAHLGAK